ncbi:hypothetical protein E5161_11425 [Cohnella pontilimi]|uniref:Uncharacterized protein n=1 Tax=Cohnella pontilimi TaxID=2564100 RepID=A0A4U0FAP1_9BACL|nr:hypothetical protein [Cohnella pontilimi]TJY41807.1 hypothetical protein E5161_11425 [Cohnella pontilimi]
MFLYPPARFDANEWFIILNSLLGFAWVFFAPVRYPHSISILIVMFCVSAAIMMDHAIAIPPVDMYDINDRPTYEWMDFFSYFLYAPYALLCVYLYDKLDPKGLWFTAWIIGWSLFCVGYEWLSVQCHVFTFKKWNLMHSFCMYLVMTTIHVQLFRYLRKHFQDRSESVFPSKTAE